MTRLRLSLFAKISILLAVFSTLPLLVSGALYVWTHQLSIVMGGLVFTAFLTLGVAFAFARHLTHPIRALMRGVQRAAQGDFSTFVEVKSHDEFSELAQSFNQMMEDLRRYSDVKLDELITEKMKTERILQSTEDGIVLTNATGHLQLVNPRAREILHLTDPVEDMAGRPVWSFVKENRLAAALRESVTNTQKPAALEVNLSTENQRLFYAVSSSVIAGGSTHPDLQWVLVTLRNVTSEKELQSLKDDFVHSLTHDLRSPLTAIRGYLRVLAEEMAGPMNSEQKKMLAIMENASSKLLLIISNLLDTAKMSAGKLQVNLTEVDLRKYAPPVVEMMHSEAEKKKIALTLEMPETISPLRVDSALLERVLLNLLSNALKFTPVGGFVTVRFAELADRIQGQVSDTGPGIPAGFMSRIFKKFEQVSGTRGGTGLGLAICKYILHAHYGDIQVDSKPGEGTIFTFWFPKDLEQNEKGEVFLTRRA